MSCRKITCFATSIESSIFPTIELMSPRVADISTRVVWEKSAADGILGALDDVDFLIKPISRHQGLIDRLHAPLDWALTRSAPCPVLISKKAWSEPNVVLAALDAGRAGVALVIPPRFSADLARGAVPSVQLLLDGTNSNTATVVLATSSSEACTSAL